MISGGQMSLNLFKLVKITFMKIMKVMKGHHLVILNLFLEIIFKVV